MTRIVGLLILALSVLFAAACQSTSESAPAARNAADPTTAIANLTFSISPATQWIAAPFGPPPSGENVALRAYSTGSARDETGLLTVDVETAGLAIDGDIDSVWSSQQPAPQWYSLLLDDLYLVDRIQMAITQAPAGPTTHEIWLGNGSGSRTLYTRLSDVPTDDGQILDVKLDPPRLVNEVFILTLESPSWVAWREVSVFGLPVTSPSQLERSPQMRLQPLASGLELPVKVTHANDASGRLFVAEKRGRIRIVRNGATLDEPFLDITNIVSCCGHRGLIDIAFPPSFADSQQFYLSYTNIEGHTVVSRFSTSPDPDRADPDSEEVVLTIDQPAEHHNGGHMAFGPLDGYLYLASGDGGSFSYPDNPALDPGTLLSKLLRIDVESGAKPYGIPDSNPFTQVDGYRGEIWALGLRNPGELTFDEVTGALFIPDSGNRRREEINHQPASSAGGEDYGWFRMEGNLCFDNFVVPCDADGLTLPVAEYDHSQGCAIAGGAVFRGPGSPNLQGLYLYADYCSGRIWGLKRLEDKNQMEWQSTLLINAPISISSIGQDEFGNLYGTSFGDGVLFMLTEKPAAPATADAPANIALHGSARASAEAQLTEFAIDGDPTSHWDSQQPAPQWFSVILDDLYLVDRLELVLPLGDTGPSTFEIWLGNGSGTRTLFKRLTDVRPENYQSLIIPIHPPQNVNEVMVVTLQSPGNVAWREVRVLGTPTTDLNAVIDAPNVRLDEVVTGVELPVLIVHAADNSGRMFVAEQKGRIRIVQDGRLLDSPFLDISNRVSCCGEQGLFGIAFPPGYAASQHFYVSYSNIEGNTIVSRFQTTNDPNSADPDSEEVVLEIEQPYKVHNGGHLAFGPQDGYLYIGSGDGGTFRDPDNWAQRPDTLLGKILRIDVESGSKPYAVPASNPFANSHEYRPEIWALGLRNPWGFAFDRQTGDLFISDVGGSLREEVNFQSAESQAGRNYGWAVMEGTICFEHDFLTCSADGLTLPVAEYDHSQGCAIVGGAVYRGSRHASLHGHFLFADFCRGYIWGLKRIDEDSTEHAPGGWQSALLTNAGFPVSSIGEDQGGNVYAAGYQNGTIYLITER